MWWYEKFKVGQKVKVVKKVATWRYGSNYGISWNNFLMDKTIGKVYKISEINKDVGYRLRTSVIDGSDYYYPVESLAYVKGEQLVFDFYK